MASTTTRLISFEEFEQLPESDWMRQELHHGELIEVPPPVQGHKIIERRLREMLENAARGAGIGETEMGFRPVIGNEYLIADVAFISREIWEAIPSDGYMVGAPELIIEVLSPSNKIKRMSYRRKICLENGCREFWVVDPKKREVEVSTFDGHTITYQPSQQIPLFFADDSNIAVDAIFES
jgi:Uma2 family endonuclease